MIQGGIFDEWSNLCFFNINVTSEPGLIELAKIAEEGVGERVLSRVKAGSCGSSGGFFGGKT